MAASCMLAEVVYSVGCNTILDSACKAVEAWDIITSMIKCWLFGTTIATVGGVDGWEEGRRLGACGAIYTALGLQLTKVLLGASC